MSETITLAIISAITTLITAGITGSVVWYVTIKKTPKEIKNLDAQAAVDFTSSFKLYAEGLDSVVKTLMSTNSDLEKRVDQLEAYRQERGLQIYSLQQTIEEMKQKDEVRAKESQSLKEKIAEFEAKNSEYKRIIERLLDVLQKVDPKLLDGIDLTETMQKIKAINK